MSSNDVILRVSGVESRRNVPITCGLPWPRGLLTDPTALRLTDEGGAAVPLQTRVLERWPGGSVRWLLLDWQASAASYRLRLDGPAPAEGGIQVTTADNAIVVETGAARFELRREGPLPFASVLAQGVVATDAGRGGLAAIDEQGKSHQPRIDRLWVDEQGLVRTKVCLEGALGNLGELIVEMDFFAGSATVRVQTTLRNPRPAGHPGGNWDLGNAGSVYLRDFSWALALPSPGRVLCSAEAGQPLQEFAAPLELYQESSGGENWSSSNHLNRHRQVPLTFRGYRLRHQTGQTAGLRATPVVWVRGDAAHLGAAVPNFWQNFPGAVEATDTTLTVRLFPKQFADAHELQGGEQKTRVVYLAFAPDHVSETPLDWCRSPAVACAEPEWYARAAAVPYLRPRGDDPDPAYARLVESAIVGENSFDSKRELIDEYGWRHFGEIYGDHEAVGHEGPAPLVSHYNNQYDAVAGFACQLFRSGDVRWLRHLDELAWHVLDIDVYHTAGDKSAYNRGLFWHTYHYQDADTGTHRSYPRALKQSAGAGDRAVYALGGGPANEHNYAAGLMLHHLLTGSRLSRLAAIERARWVIDVDDGGQTVFRWLASGATGLASCSRSMAYHGPGRGSGNSLSALVDGHRLTGESEYLDKAEELIRRVIHPADDVAAMNLLDVENRWFYTMFLHALGKYLDHKAALGQFDSRYAYGRAALLRYAQWMAEHEYPYLEKPEVLDYPTETWAAQDMRKSDVFWYAWLHADRGDRERFRERATFFYRYVVGKLETMPTRHLCRPVVLLLSHGYRQAWFEQNADAWAPAAKEEPADFGRPQRFEPQKTRALRRFKRLAAAAAVGILAGVVGVAWLVWRQLA